MKIIKFSLNLLKIIRIKDKSLEIRNHMLILHMVSFLQICNISSKNVTFMIAMWFSFSVSYIDRRSKGE